MLKEENEIVGEITDVNIIISTKTLSWPCPQETLNLNLSRLLFLPPSFQLPPLPLNCCLEISAFISHSMCILALPKCVNKGRKDNDLLRIVRTHTPGIFLALVM